MPGSRKVHQSLLDYAADEKKISIHNECLSFPCSISQMRSAEAISLISSLPNFRGHISHVPNSMSDDLTIQRIIALFIGLRIKPEI